MKTVSDKIFITVFTGFIAAIMTASVVIAKHNALRMSQDEAGTVPASLQDLNVDKNADEYKKNAVVGEVAPGVAQSPLAVMTPEQLKILVAEAFKISTKKPAVPMWKKVLYAAKMPYDLLMKIPASVQIVLALYLMRKYMPHLVADFMWDATKYGAKTAVGVTADVAADVGRVATEKTLAALATYTPDSVVNNTLVKSSQAAAQDIFARQAAWAEIHLDGFAKWLGY